MPSPHLPISSHAPEVTEVKNPRQLGPFPPQQNTRPLAPRPTQDRGRNRRENVDASPSETINYHLKVGIRMLT